MGSLTKSKRGAYVLPAIASAILPGVGQLIKGQIGKGVAFLAVVALWGVVNFLFGWLPLSGLLIPVLGIFLWLVNVLDAAFNSVGQRH